LKSESRLKLLIDIGVGKKVETYLSEIGYDVLSVRSLNPHMRDVDILDLAVKEKRLVITMDKDFVRQGGLFIIQKNLMQAFCC